MSDSPPDRTPALMLTVLGFGHLGGWLAIVAARFSDEGSFYSEGFGFLMFGLVCAGATCAVVLSTRLPLLFKVPLWLVAFLASTGMFALLSSGWTPSQEKFVVSLIVVTPAAAAEVPLWFVRALVGYEFRWRSDAWGPPPLETNATEIPSGDSQFRMWHLFVLTAVVAAFCATIRALLPADFALGDGTELIMRTLMICLFVSPMVAGCLWLAMAILLPSPTSAARWGTVACCGVFGGLFGLLLLFTMLAQGPDTIRPLILLSGSLTCQVTLSLLLLRAAGLVFDTTDSPKPSGREPRQDRAWAGDSGVAARAPDSGPDGVGGHISSEQK